MARMTTSHKLYINFDNDKQKMVLPFLPNVITRKDSSQDDLVDLTDNRDLDIPGQVIIPRSRELQPLKIMSILPYKSFPGCVSGMRTPHYYRQRIRKWRATGKPVHVILTGTTLNGYFRIVSFEFTEGGLAPGDYDYTLQLIEWRRVKPRKIVVSSSGAKATPSSTSSRPNNAATQKTYTVKNGDTLIRIARAVLGDSSRYKEIASLNGIKPPYILSIGHVLVMPSK